MKKTVAQVRRLSKGLTGLMSRSQGHNAQRWWIVDLYASVGERCCDLELWTHHL